MENLTNQEVIDLLALTEKATPGPWPVSYLAAGLRYADSNCDGNGMEPGESDAAYIAAANPTTLRRLLLELQQHRATAATGAAGEAGGELTERQIQALLGHWQGMAGEAVTSEEWHAAAKRMEEVGYDAASREDKLAYALGKVLGMWYGIKSVLDRRRETIADLRAQLNARVPGEPAPATAAAPRCGSGEKAGGALRTWLHRVLLDAKADPITTRNVHVRLDEALATMPSAPSNTSCGSGCGVVAPGTPSAGGRGSCLSGCGNCGKGGVQG